MCPLPPRRPLPGDPWEGPAPGWRGRTEVISRVRGRPQAIFVLPLGEPNSVIKRSRAPCLQFGPFPPPKAELDPILPPALPVSSPVEEWAAGGRRRWIKSFLFSESPGVWARGLGRPGAAGGGRGRGRGGGHLPARPGGGGRGRLLLGFLGAGRGRGGGERGGGGPGLRPRPPAPAPRPRHAERTSQACTVTLEVKETGTHGPTSHRNKGGGLCGLEGDTLGWERDGGRGGGGSKGVGRPGSGGLARAGGSEWGERVGAGPGPGSVGGRRSTPGPGVCVVAGTAL